MSVVSGGARIITQGGQTLRTVCLRFLKIVLCSQKNFFFFEKHRKYKKH